MTQWSALQPADTAGTVRLRPTSSAVGRRVVTGIACVALWASSATPAGTRTGILDAASPRQNPLAANQTGTQTAVPCTAGPTRYVDCQNGTVIDTVTGLIWLKRADCFPESNWKAALQAAATLKAGECGLTDGSAPGDWRLPTKAEWEATIAAAAALGCTFAKSPSLTNDAGTGCYGNGAPSSRLGVRSNGYWSSTLGEVHPLLTIFPNTPVASFANLYHGDVIAIESMLEFGVWPVRAEAAQP